MTAAATILRELERGDTDAELLARFAAAKDSQAFAELVRRHGPLVLGVCRRVTGHPQDAEDAFQATFLVLAKKAAVLRKPELLGNYLYGVAFRVASRARRSALRRQRREVTVAALPDPPAPAEQSAASELLPIVDQELAQLAECYRGCIVLCDLKGLSREEAAAALGIPEGTLSSRLANGRKKLAARLARRGVSLAAALPLLLAEATAAVPTELVTKTCGLVAHWASGGSVPVALAKLASGGLNVRAILVLGAVFAAGAVGAVFAAQPRDNPPPADPPKPPVLVARAEPLPQPKDEPKKKDKPVVGFTDKPRMLRSFDVPTGNFADVRWNATGTHFAFRGFTTQRVGEAVVTRPVVLWWAVNGKERWEVNAEVGASLAAVAADGQSIVTDIREYRLISGRHQLIRLNGVGGIPEGGKVDLDLPETHGYAFAADMKTFRTVTHLRDASGFLRQLEVLEVDAATGKTVRSLLKVDYNDRYALSANGNRLAILESFPWVGVYDFDRGKRVSFTKTAGFTPHLPDDRYVVMSPDGRRFISAQDVKSTKALNSRQAVNGLKALALEVIVYDADTGAPLPQLEDTSAFSLRPDTLTFSSDGRLVAGYGTSYKKVGVNLFQPEVGSWEVDKLLLSVWDTKTGKVVKRWDRTESRGVPKVAFSPTRPLLAILEPNGEQQTRVGFWDFAAEVEK